MLEKNFVSLSGVTSSNELVKIAQIKERTGIEYPLAIGYQLSNKSMNQGINNKRQPPFESIRELDRLTKSRGLIPSYHYYTKNNSTTFGDLERLAKEVDLSNRTLLQLNTLPLQTDDYRKIKNLGFEIIYKLPISNKESGGYAVWKGDEVQDASKGDARILIRKAKKVVGFADHLMFDPSHGTNHALDLSEDSLAIQFGDLVSINAAMVGMGLVYAGGINPENAKEVIERLKGHFEEIGFSIDTESGVRNERNELDLNKVRDYLIACKHFNN